MAITVPRPRLIGSPVIYEAGINVAIANADGATFTELLRIPIPSEPGWVTIRAKVAVQANTAGQQASALAGLLPAGGNALNLKDFFPLLSVGAASGANSEVYGRHTRLLEVNLPPNSPGEWVLGATRLSGSNAANMGGTALVPAFIKATREW